MELAFITEWFYKNWDMFLILPEIELIENEAAIAGALISACGELLAAGGAAIAAACGG